MKIFSKLFFLFAIFYIPSIITGQVSFTDVAPTMGVNDGGSAQGVVFLDVNNDGFLDIYLVNNGQANKLWINTTGTSFTESGAAWNVNYTGAGRGCSAADFDNDGLIDIMVGNYNQVLILYKNNSTSFTNYTTTAGVNLMCWGGSINWLDYNSDGKIDITVANDGVPYHYNYLFRNDNLLSFTNVAYTSGITDSASTLCIASADYDNDGDIDIFYGNQTNIPSNGTSFLYQNNGNGTFTNVTVAAGLINPSYSWAADWGDYDNDGDLDLYVGNTNGMNQLFKNNGNGTFTDVAVTVGIDNTSSIYSCGWGDYENDGDLDLYVAKGINQPDRLYKNDGGMFTDVAASIGMNDLRHSSAISWGDFNKDGFLDLYLNNNGTENRLFKSNAGNSNKWTVITLRGVASNRSAVGARVTVKTGTLTQIREVQGGSGGKGQNSLPVEFGLGAASVIDSLIIRWPSGTVQTFTNVVTNKYITANEGQNLVGISNHTAKVDNYNLSQNYPNPFNPTTNIRFDLPKSGIVKLVVFDALGREVATLVNEKLAPGTYEVDWDGSNYTSSVYFYKLMTGDFVDVKKMLLIK